jgi:hypothetical protein
MNKLGLETGNQTRLPNGSIYGYHYYGEGAKINLLTVFPNSLVKSE